MALAHQDEETSICKLASLGAKQPFRYLYISVMHPLTEDKIKTHDYIHMITLMSYLILPVQYSNSQCYFMYLSKSNVIDARFALGLLSSLVASL